MADFRGRFRFPVVDVLPASPEEGEVVYLVGSGHRWFDGTTWVALT